MCFRAAPVKRAFCALGALMLGAAAARAGNIATDGSLSGTVAKTIAGPDFLIPSKIGGEALGVKVGNNLFHSFSAFNLSQGESAAFTGLDGAANVIARVTGGASSIDGRISCDANLFLMNPAGIMFKEHATLDVSGSFTATTAHSLKLGGDGQFFASIGEQSVLTSSPVSAFGFTSAPAAISVSGSALAVSAGKSLSLVGGNLSLNQGARLAAPSGLVSLYSAATSGAAGADLKPLRRMGSVNISGKSRVDAGGSPGGAVVIRGGQLTVDNSTVVSGSEGGQAAGGIDVHVRGAAAVVRNSRVLTTTAGTGRAGDVTIRAGRLNLSSNSLIGSQALSTASTSARAGRVSVAAQTVAISDESSISASTFGLGRGGAVEVAAEKLSIRGDSSDVPTGIFSNSNSTGKGGAGGGVRVKAGILDIVQGGAIAADTAGVGAGGDVDVRANEISIAAKGATVKTGIFADTLSLGAGGNGGDVRINALRLRITDGGLISTKTLGLGKGGDTTVNVRELTISRGASSYYTGIAADSPLGGRRGEAGDVRVTADTVRLFDGGQISSNTFGLGDGGSVSVSARDILLVGGLNDGAFTSISADSISEGAGGRGGNVEVTADSLRILDGGRISANTFGAGAGGDVSVRAGEAVISGSHSAEFTGVSAESVSATEPGVGGSVHVQAKTLMLMDGGGIAANTRGPGAGGDVLLAVGSATLLQGGRVSAETSGLGAGGSVSARVTDLAISGAQDGRSSGVFTGSTVEGEGGSGGRMEIRAASLRLSNGGAVAATSSSTGAGGSVRIAAGSARIESGASIEASATGAGVAGSVAIVVREPFVMESGGAVRTTSAVSSSGTVDIRSGTDIQLRDSSVTVRAAQGDAGSVSLRTPGTLRLRNSTVVAEAGLNGGDVFIDPEYVLLDHSIVSANAVLGAGGHILIIADSFLASSSAVTASSEASVQGTVTIESPNADLANSLAPLSSAVLDASTQLRDQCARRLGLDFSSFLVLGRGGVSVAPADPQASFGPVVERTPPKIPPRR